MPTLPDVTTCRTLAEEHNRFAGEQDYIELTSDEVRPMCASGAFPERTARRTLLTRLGCLKLVKPLTCDLSWEGQAEMTGHCFLAETTAAVLPMRFLARIARTG
jgi:hypothetical protein